MKNPKITRKITQGMYVLTTPEGGCVVDAVSRVSASERPRFAVAVAKKNHSHQLLADGEKFALSIIGEKCDPQMIEIFGFKSCKDTDKLATIETETIEGVPVVKDTLGYLVCKKIDAVDCDTHTLYIGEMIEGDVYEDGVSMTYAYYQDHKDDLIKTETEQGKTAWVCKACGYVYYGDEVPDDYKCPLCGLGKEYFEKKV